jgi:hypothetical protein
MHFKGGILTPFMLLLILYGPMRLTHSQSHGIVPASFSGKLPYFWIVSFEFDK